MSAAQPTREEVARLTQRLTQAQDLALAALARAGRQEAAEEGRAIMRRAEGTPARVIVVGETKRGKSSLVNALLRRPRLSPVDPAVTTATPISFVHAAEERARVVLAAGGRAGETRDIALDDLPEWVSVRGNPGNARGVLSVEVGLPLPLLDGLVLLDTPGVGGLDSGHGELTMQALDGADALLFVLDAGAPLGVTELGFLGRASSRIETVGIVVTKTDAHHGWERIVADDRELLRSHAPRLAGAPMFAVSNVLVEEALALGPGEDARLLLKEAGLHEVESFVRGVAGRGPTLRQLNFQQFLLGNLAAVEGSIAASIRAAEGDESVAEELAAEERRLEDLHRETADWHLLVSAEAQKTSVWRAETLDAGMREIEARYRELVRGKLARDPEVLAERLDADIGALAGALAEGTTARLVEALDRIGEVVDEGSGAAGHLSELSGRRLSMSADAGRISHTPFSDSEKLQAVLMVSAGAGLARFLPLALPVLGPVALPIAVGGLVATIFVRSRNTMARQQDLRVWVGSTLQEARREIDRDFQRWQIDATVEMTRLINARIAARQAEVARDLKGVRDRAAASRQQREQAADELRMQLAAVLTARSACRDTADELRRLSGLGAAARQPR